MSIERSDFRYSKARNKFLGVCELHATPCWLCGKPIDYNAKANTPNAFELDHAQSVRDFPELVYEPSNFRASHHLCNRRRGVSTIPVSARPTSWTRANW